LRGQNGWFLAVAGKVTGKVVLRDGGFQAVATLEGSHPLSSAATVAVEIDEERPRLHLADAERSR
jgi:hypothetical protein